MVVLVVVVVAVEDLGEETAARQHTQETMRWDSRTHVQARRDPHRWNRAPRERTVRERTMGLAEPMRGRHHHCGSRCQQAWGGGRQPFQKERDVRLRLSRRMREETGAGQGQTRQGRGSSSSSRSNSKPAAPVAAAGVAGPSQRKCGSSGTG